MVRIAILGATGRMGTQLIQAVVRAPETYQLTRAIVRAGHPATDTAVPQTDCRFTATWSDDWDVLIDFSSPEITSSVLTYCHAHQKALVIGTTGLSDALHTQMQLASQSIPICYATNFSPGIHILHQIVHEAAQRFGLSVDTVITDIHHRDKQDTPSGTALAIENTLRQVHPSAPIDFSIIRAADIVGEHRVMFATAGEQLEVRHQVSDRGLFAQGALRAAKWLMQKNTAGLFTMSDIMSAVPSEQTIAV